jgi:hypothetical protein
VVSDLSDTFDGLEAALSDDICVCKCEAAPRLINTTQNMSSSLDALALEVIHQ